MRINHNISALKANNQLARTNKLLDSSLERLSSGYRINSAADDSAGLAISEKMRTQISGLEQSSRNASDGISVIQTAEGALVEVEAMLQRMRELAVESANGIYTTDDRIAIQAEIDQLNEEINRISETTEFNTMKLLDGNIDRKSYSSDNRVNIVSLSDTVSVGDYGVKITQDARQAVIVGNQTNFTGTTTERKITKDEAGSININGESVKIEAGDTVAKVFEKIRNACDHVDINVFANKEGEVPSTNENLDMAGYKSKPFENGDRMVFVSREYGSEEKISIYCDSPELCDLLGLTISGASANGYDAKAQLMLNGEDANSLFENTATLSVKGNRVTVSDRNNFSMVFQVEPGTVGSKFEDSEITASNAALTPGYIVTQDARQAVVVGNTVTAGTLTENKTITINGKDITLMNGSSLTDVYNAIKAGISDLDITLTTIAEDAKPSAIPTAETLATAGYTSDDTLNAGERLLFVSDGYGANEKITIEISGDIDGELAGMLGLTTAGIDVDGTDAKIELAAKAAGAAGSDKITYTVDGNHIVFTNDKGVEIGTSDINPATMRIGTEYTDRTVTGPDAALSDAEIQIPTEDMVLSVLDAGPMDLQIGANEGQIMSVRIPRVTPETLGIDKVNIATADGAQEAIGLLDIAINQVSAIRSKLGAYQNRLEHSISNLDVTSENMTESLSRIEDADMAEEMAEYTQKNILAQAGTSMLAQANQRPQTILTLLQQ